MSIVCLITSLSSHCLTCQPQLMEIWQYYIFYVNKKIDMNVKYTAHTMQDLCETRDLNSFELFDNTEI